MSKRLLDIPLLKSDGWKKAWEFLFAGGARCFLCEQIHGVLWNGICHACIDKVPWIGPPICEDCGRAMEAGTGSPSVGHAPTPPHVGEQRCGDCLRRGHSSFVYNRSAVTYDDPMVTWLHSYKYKGMQRLAQPLGEMMLQAYWVHYTHVPFDAITYIPLYEERQRDRGFNQAEQLARHVSRHTGISLFPMLVRNRHTDKQSQRDRRSRISLLQGVFEVNLNPDSTGTPDPRRNYPPIKRILLIDDVYTTGTTVSEAASVLRNHWEADVYVLTLAR